MGGYFETLIFLYGAFWLTDARLSEGFIAYCPCMGRFGNQADHFLGALAFSKALNRTLILPPWVEYRYGEPRSIQVPFDSYFEVDALLQYNEVITMEKFMIEHAPIIWPKDKRISFCYVQRTGSLHKSCNAKSGNPFGPFWDTFDIDFVASEFYGPLNYDATNMEMMELWNKKYSSETWPVLAFTGAPASFPVQKENRGLQKYLKWNDKILNKLNSFVKTNMGGGAYIGVHLRNGQDWSRACEHVKESPTLFASPQCIGYKNENGPLSISMCFPEKSDIIKQVKRAVKKVNNTRYVFVASDHDHMISDLSSALESYPIKVLKLTIPDPHLDLSILGNANYFIGNCVSSFSAFVKRERDVKGLPSEFWSFPRRKKIKHEEF